MLPAHIPDALKGAVGAAGLITDAGDFGPYVVEEATLPESQFDLVVRPKTTAEVAAVVRICAESGVPIVPLGGATGLVGGGIAAGGIILSTERMNQIVEIDALNHTMTVEAGVVLADIQKAAADADCLFPLSLGAEGSCRIGGNLSTNAGGVGVLRYGNAEDLVLGLEVVLPDGQVWDGLSALRKDNTGYHLKNLFLGAEGTLGIITKAVLKLFPKPRAKVVAFAGTADAHAILALFDRVRRTCGDRLTAFEMIPGDGIELCLRHMPGTVDPMRGRHAMNALIELTSPRAGDDLRGDLEEVLHQAMTDGVVEDAVFAESEGQARKIWEIREKLPDAEAQTYALIRHDVSVPVSRTAEFIDEASRRAQEAIPGAGICAFGHIGDGNIHFHVTQPADMDAEAFLAKWEECNRVVHDYVMTIRGSFSAEHGIGLIKRAELDHYGSDVGLDLMRRIKRTLDPKNIMNPGKVIEV